MKILLLCLVLLLVGMVGCSTVLPIEPVATTEPEIAIGSTGDGTVVLPMPTSIIGSAIGVKAINISGFHSGAEADFSVPVYNPSTSDVGFIFYFIASDDLREGYVKAPDYVQNWLVLPQDPIVIPSGQGRDVLFRLIMPKDAKKFADKWEFHIGVAPLAQVQPAVAFRVLVTMR